MVAFLYQALIEAEATDVVGAERHERTRPDDPAKRHPAGLTTKAGDVECGSRSSEKGSFFPCVLERRRRIDQALYAVVMEAYVHGVSTRKVDDLVRPSGRRGISKSEVSRICAQLDKELEAFRTGPSTTWGSSTCSVTPPT